jgi:hypothetical protein
LTISIASFHHPIVITRKPTRVAALEALINVIGVLLSEIDCVECWELTTKVVETSFVQMLKDVPVMRADVEAEQRVVCLHCRRISGSRP